MSNLEDRRRTASERVLGGSPAGVLIRLLVTSFVVGIVLRALDVRVADVVRWTEEKVRQLSSLSFETLGDLGNVLVLGAVIVVPIWLVLRVLRLIAK